jgi:hypothetical protein
MKIYGLQPNKIFNYILCFYFISNNSLSPSMCVYIYIYIYISNPHQIPKLHPKFFTSKSNLKIKLIKCLNPIQQISHHQHGLLSLCHSLGNKDVHIYKFITHQISSNLIVNAFEFCYLINLKQNNVLKIFFS